MSAPHKMGSLGGAENLLDQYSRRGILNRLLSAAFEADEAAGEFDKDDMEPGALLQRAQAYGEAAQAFSLVLEHARDGDFGSDLVDFEPYSGSNISGVA